MKVAIDSSLVMSVISPISMSLLTMKRPLDERIGNRSYYDSTGQQDYALTKPFSEKTAEIIDEQVSEIIEKAYKEALRILEENKDGLTQLANKLIEKEVVFGDDLETIFGKRPWVKEEIDFPKESQQATDSGQQSESTEENLV